MKSTAVAPSHASFEAPIAGRKGSARTPSSAKYRPCKKKMHGNEDRPRDPESPRKLMIVLQCFGGDRCWKPDWFEGKKNAPAQCDDEQNKAEQHRNIHVSGSLVH